MKNQEPPLDAARAALDQRWAEACELVADADTAHPGHSSTLAIILMTPIWQQLLPPKGVDIVAKLALLALTELSVRNAERVRDEAAEKG